MPNCEPRPDVTYDQHGWMVVGSFEFNGAQIAGPADYLQERGRSLVWFWIKARRFDLVAVDGVADLMAALDADYQGWLKTPRAV